MSFKQELIPILKKCWLFSDLDQEAINELEAISEYKKFLPQETLFYAGDFANRFYLIIEGNVDLINSSDEGKKYLVRRVTKGQVFAEAAIFSGLEYPVTGIAKTEVEVLGFQKEKFFKLVKKYPELSLKVIEIMSRLLRHMSSLIKCLSLEKVSSRLASFILSSAKDSMEFTLKFSKQDLAFQLGTVPETLSRNLKKLQNNGVVKVSGNKIRINDLKKLKEIAG